MIKQGDESRAVTTWDLDTVSKASLGSQLHWHSQMLLPITELAETVWPQNYHHTASVWPSSLSYLNCYFWTQWLSFPRSTHSFTAGYIYWKPSLEGLDLAVLDRVILWPGKSLLPAVPHLIGLISVSQPFFYPRGFASLFTCSSPLHYNSLRAKMLSVLAPAITPGQAQDLAHVCTQQTGTEWTNPDYKISEMFCRTPMLSFGLPW